MKNKNALTLVIISSFIISSNLIANDSKTVGAEAAATVKEVIKKANHSEKAAAKQADKKIDLAPKTVKELIKKDLVVGKGAEAKSGKKVTVHYTGTLMNGTKFDSSLDRKEPFTFNLGAGQVIKGWDEGVAGMKVGGKRQLTIPAHMAYGERDLGVIPANSPLKFDVELLKVE